MTRSLRWINPPCYIEWLTSTPGKITNNIRTIISAVQIRIEAPVRIDGWGGPSIGGRDRSHADGGPGGSSGASVARGEFFFAHLIRINVGLSGFGKHCLKYA